MTTAVINSSFVQRREERLAAEEEALNAEIEAYMKGDPEDTELETKPEEKGEVTEEEVSEGKTKDGAPTSREEQTFKKRYGDLRRHMQAKEKEYQDKLDALKNNKGNLPAAQEDLEAWVKENAEVAKMIDTIAAKKAEEQFQRADERLQHLDQETFKLQREKAEAEIRKKHPDFEDLRVDDKFHDWVASQPKLVQNALYDDPDDFASVIRAIDLYKADMGLTTKGKKEAEVNAAAAVNTPAGGKPAGEQKTIWSESRVAKLSDQEYAKAAAEIDKALADGTFVYDLS